MYLRIINEDTHRFCSISQNYKIQINLNDTSENHIWLGIKPTYIHQFLNSNLGSESVFIDCGANIGIWSLIAQETIQEIGKVHSFEPNPALFKRLTKNLDFNKVCKNSICYPMGLSSKFHSAFLNLDDNHHQMGSLHTEFSGEKVKVELITLDSLKLDRIDGIKIDVEGHELEVLKGALESLKKNKPWLLIELNNLFCNISKITQWDVYKLLFGLGYSSNFYENTNLSKSYCRDILFYYKNNNKSERLPSFL